MVEFRTLLLLLPPERETPGGCGRARRRLRQWHVHGLFSWFRCSLRCRLAQSAWHHGRCGPEGQFCADLGRARRRHLQWNVHGWFGWLRCILRCVLSASRQARVARHHDGWFS